MRKILLLIGSFILVGCSVQELPESTTEINLPKEESDIHVSQISEKDDEKNPNEIVSLATEFPIKVISNQYMEGDSELKALYPDMVLTVLKNGSNDDVKDIYYSILAWDENNLPVKIKTSLSFYDAEYVGKIQASDMNLIPEAQSPDNFGIGLDETVPRLHTIKAVVESYEDFDGNTILNEHYKDFIELYEGKKLTVELDI